MMQTSMSHVPWVHRSKARCRAAASTLIACATPALAHHQPPGFEDVDEFDNLPQIASSFLHPFTGADHLLLALAMGSIAYVAGKKAGSALGASFIGSMALGMMVGRLGLGLPILEQGLAFSVILAGLVMAYAVKQSSFGVLALSVLAGFWHGNAHGVEMPATVSAMASGLAMLLGTLSISAVGIGLASVCSLRESLPGRWAGVALAIAGVWLWIA
ncbi:MAG: HupE/UreJ family protein [Roseimicrobium sp.]